MEYDEEKVDEMALALLYLTVFNDIGGPRAWKGLDWDVLNRLCEKGYLYGAKGKAKSVGLTDEGLKKAEELFKAHFGK